MSLQKSCALSEESSGKQVEQTEDGKCHGVQEVQDITRQLFTVNPDLEPKRISKASPRNPLL